MNGIGLLCLYRFFVLEIGLILPISIFLLYKFKQEGVLTLALFKIFKGNNTAKITNSSATGYITPTDGYAYYDTSSKLFYIDAAYSGTTISRQPINADNAANGVFYGTCPTAQGTKAKVATLTNGTGFSLKAGTIVAIKFTYASAASTMTLNVNSTGAKNLYQYGSTLMNSGTTTTGWPAGAVVPFVYDGTYWFRLYWTNTGTVTSITPGNGLLNGTGTSAITTTGTLNLNYGTSASAIGTTSAAGSANTVSRSDHVHSITLATGDNNGQVKIAGTNVSVKGLGSNAYTSTAYAPLASPALTGTPTAPTPAATSNDTTIATTAFVMNAFTANDVMVFKGVINANEDLPTTHKQGWTYRVATAGTYAGKVCEVGDMIVCVTDGTAANNDHWAVIQNNVDGAVYRGTNAFTDANVIVADSTNGKVKSSGKTITTTAPSSSAADTTIPTSKAVWSAISGASGYGKTGTVTSVRVQATAPIISSSSAAATTSLNTTISLAATSANYVIAGPTSGTTTAVPTYRKLVAADIPSLTKSKISDFPTNVSAFTNDSGYVTSSGVTDITFNTSDSIIYKTINGTTSSIVEIPILAGSGNNSAYGGGATAPSKATAFAFGISAEANGINSIALGANSKANSMHSISLGLSSSTTGIRSIAIGYAASTSGTDAIAIGSGVLANGAKQMALGCYNIADTSSTYCLIVGNGTADDARSNAMTVDYNGNLDVTGNIKANNITNDTISASSTSATIPTSDAVWAAISGASGYGKVGTVTSVQVQATSPIVSSSSASSSTSLSTTISLADNYGDTKNPYASKTKNYVLAAPSTENGTPTFRQLVAADIPNLDWSKITTGNDDLKAIENLTGTSGLLKKTAANTWTLDTTAYTTNTGTVTSITAGAGLNTTSNDTATDGGSITATGTLYLTKTGVTASSYGNSTSATLAHSGTFTVPYITVDKYGRITAAANKVITLPASGNVDTKVNQELYSANYNLPLLMSYQTINNTTTTVNNKVFRNNSIYANPSTGMITAKTFKVVGSNNSANTITSDAANNIYFVVNSHTPLVMTDTEVRSGSGSGDSGAINLGASNIRWNNIYANNINTPKITAPTSDGGSTYGAGSSGQALLSNGTNVYWGNVSTTLKFTNKTVAAGTSGWTDNDTTYSGFPYKANITCTGVTANHVPNVIFDYNELTSGNFCPFADSGDGIVSIYCKIQPTAAITIPTIYCV